MQDVINASVRRPTTPEAAGAMDKTQQIFQIKACKGISIRPLTINDINLESAKSIVLQSLYVLLHWIIACDSDVYEEPDPSIPCRSMADERGVLSIAQDVIHSASMLE